MRDDKVDELREELEVFGASFEGTIEEGEADGYTLILMEGEPVAFRSGQGVLPTVRGIMHWGSEERSVTVDAGAVKHVYNGADVMAPGIVEADPEIEEGDAVFVDEENHGKPLAVGVALMDGEEMAASGSGRAVEAVHHVGDELWELSE